MSHPVEHAKSSARKFGGSWLDYLEIHEWFDATKAWIGHSKHRMFRHHSEGIFECEKVFGQIIENSDGKKSVRKIYWRAARKRRLQWIYSKCKRVG
jgi:hypothetical protein